MSTTDTADAAGLDERRVRHLAGDALAVMAFSATVSVIAACGLVLLAGLGR